MSQLKQVVDQRLIDLVDYAVRTQHRGFVAVTGKYSMQAVPLLHHFLSKARTTVRPSVLWCYEDKESLRLLQRAKKQDKLRKRSRAGPLDPASEDQFDMFLASTPVRFCYYRDTASVLGQTYGMLVLQDFEAVTPNVLARTIETIEGGGLVVLLLRQQQSLESLKSLKMAVHSHFCRVTESRSTDISTSLFNSRFIASLSSLDTALCLRHDDVLVAPDGSAILGDAPEDAKVMRKLLVVPDVFRNRAERSGYSRKPLSGAGATPEALQLREKDSARDKKILDAVQEDKAGCDSFVQTASRSDALRGVGGSAAAAGPGQRLVAAARTQDQARALLVLLEKIRGPLDAPVSFTQRRTVALTAARGRGKSATLGLAVAGALATGIGRVVVTAPSIENVATLMQFVVQGLEKMGFRDGAHFATHMATSASEAVKAGLKSGRRADETATAVDCIETITFTPRAAPLDETAVPLASTVGRPQTVQFLLPATAAQLRGSADLLVVDEAAAIPLPTVKALLGRAAGIASASSHDGVAPVALLASTVAGYEGTGRSLAIKLFDTLRQAAKASATASAAANTTPAAAAAAPTEPEGPADPAGSAERAETLSAITFSELKLRVPVRYSLADPVEEWLTSLLLLDAEASSTARVSLPDKGACQLFKLDKSLLFSHNKQCERFLRAVWALFVTSHYKNSPNDLQLFADAPSHDVFVLLSQRQLAAYSEAIRAGKSKAPLPDIICAVQVAYEGQIVKGTVRRELLRGSLPAGDMIPWRVAAEYRDYPDVRDSFPSLSGVRVVRIATHPAYQGMQYGTNALLRLTDYFAASGIAKDAAVAPGLLHVASPEHAPATKVDWIGTAFGHTYSLQRFWEGAGFSPIYMSQRPNETTGECSCMYLRPAGRTAADTKDFAALPRLAAQDTCLLATQLTTFFSQRLVRLLTCVPALARLHPMAALRLLRPGLPPFLDDGRAPLHVSAPREPVPAWTGPQLEPFVGVDDAARLRRVLAEGSELHRIADLVPVVAQLVLKGAFGGAEPPKRHHLLFLVGCGLQGRSVDDLHAALLPEVVLATGTTLAVGALKPFARAAFDAHRAAAASEHDAEQAALAAEAATTVDDVLVSPDAEINESADVAAPAVAEEMSGALAALTEQFAIPADVDFSAVTPVALRAGGQVSVPASVQGVVGVKRPRPEGEGASKPSKKGAKKGKKAHK
jgi:N-acetyltransferase 10